MKHSANLGEEEDRILRAWTPRILRTILIVSTLILLVGIWAMATRAPGFYITRFHQVQHGLFRPQENLAQLLAGARHRDPHSITTLGLYALTLVPLVRVAFTFFLFLKERDFAFVLATAYVLTGLMVGVMLGRVG